MIIDCEVVEINKKLEPNRTSILLGKNIVYFRQLRQLSQDTLAQQMNSDKGYLSQIENAKRNASTDYIDRLAKIFNVEPEEMLKEREFKLKNRVDSKQQITL